MFNILIFNLENFVCNMVADISLFVCVCVCTCISHQVTVIQEVRVLELNCDALGGKHTETKMADGVRLDEEHAEERKGHRGCRGGHF